MVKAAVLHRKTYAFAMPNRNYGFSSELSLQNKGCNIVTTSWCNDKKLIAFSRNLQETNKGIPKYPFSVTPMGFKPMTLGTGILRSIQLSYGANKLIAKIQLYLMQRYCQRVQRKFTFNLPSAAISYAKVVQSLQLTKFTFYKILHKTNVKIYNY